MRQTVAAAAAAMTAAVGNEPTSLSMATAEVVTAGLVAATVAAGRMRKLAAAAEAVEAGRAVAAAGSKMMAVVALATGLAASQHFVCSPPPGSRELGATRPALVLPFGAGLLAE